ncbi:MAG: hypothetical protein FWG44_05495 [Oscillospiraceae bacterium]|nr:hypothetical protein [Oscillospiraceae bacterium]
MALSELEKKKKLICTLVIDFSFLPQVIWAAVLFFQIKNESPVLIRTGISSAFLAVCAEIVVFSLFCIIKRFYFLRGLLVCSYIQLIVTAFYFQYSQIYLKVWLFGVFGITVAVANLYALVHYRKLY